MLDENLRRKLQQSMSGVNIQRAEKITGWMGEAELIWLAEQAQQHTRIVEVGCWLGRSTRAIADNCQGTVWAVDVWVNNGEYLGSGDLYTDFLANIEGTTIIPIRDRSTDVAAIFANQNQTFDMIFIDAAHDYESVKADLLAWWPLLTPTGLLCGHDYDAPGVKRALDGLVPKVVTVAGSIWMKQV
jgi:predicted O-methyltransferase YrrM